MHEAWRRADDSGARVATADGRSFRILYSGMPGGSLGPDFRDAVLEATDGSEVQGDIEIHRESSDWYAHRHHEDHRYGRVVFHAIGSPVREEGGSATLNALGFVVDEIAMEPLMSDALVPPGARRTRVDRDKGSDESVEKWLDAAGDERFAQLVAGKRVDVERFGPDLAMQMSIFECLGFPRNRSQFRMLAQRLPWAFLVRFAHRIDGAWNSGVDDGDVWRADELLRWGAGFGPKPAWSPVPALMGEPPAWCKVASRPANRPEGRVRSAAHLVAEWWRGGGPLRCVSNAIVEAENASQLRDGFRSIGGIGAGRAGEVVVNAVLPTIAAWAIVGGDGVLFQTAKRLFSEHPSLPSNSVLREAEHAMRCRGARVARISGARRQQGAMLIYKTMLLRPRPSAQLRLGRRVMYS